MSRVQSSRKSDVTVVLTILGGNRTCETVVLTISEEIGRVKPVVLTILGGNRTCETGRPNNPRRKSNV